MQSSYLLINGLRAHYIHWNLGEDGLPVVLLHGLASNARIWELIGPVLAKGGLVPLAPDGRGHGLTDKPDGDYGFDTFHRDLSAFLDALNLERPLLVGHSWGASLALDYAARIPFGPRAPAGLVLLDGGMTQMDDAPDATWEKTRDRLTPPRLAGRPLAEFMHYLKDGHSNWKPDERSIGIILANFEIREDGDDEPVERIYPNLTFERHMQIVRAMWEFKTYERFQRVHCPVLMLPARQTDPGSAAQDAYVVARQRGIKQAQEHIRQLEVKWLEKTIHDAPLQRPELVAKHILEFGQSLT